jgi:ABC-2 type transport system permease protein
MKFFSASQEKLREMPIDMRQFLIFIKKEFYHITRDKWTMAVLLLLPILMLLLFGYAITTEVKNTRLAVYDPSHDKATEAIINKLQANDYFILSQILTEPNEIEKVFQEGDIGLVIVFGERFYENIMHTGEAQIQLITDGTDPNTATTLTNYAMNIISSYRLEILTTNNIPFQIVPNIKLLYNPQMKGAFNFVPGVMGMILMLICAMMTSISIAREKEMGTMEILLVSPMKPIFIILSKAVPYFVISIVNLTTILLISVFIMGVPVAGSFFWLITLSLIYIFLSLALGLLISAIVDSQLIALLISGMALMIPIIFLSGMMFPVENMPIGLRIISEILPAKWYIIAVKKLMIKGLGFSSIINELLILSGMTLFFLVVSLKKFKTRLE